jgi:hypothetical protein
MMVVHPVEPDDDKAKNVGTESRPQPNERSDVGIVRRLQFQHHDGDDDGDDPVTERFQPIGSHVRGIVSVQ